MEDIKDFWNKYWHKPNKVMANEFGHNESNKELALKFAKAYTDHKLKLLGIADVVNQRELLLKKQSDWLMTETNLRVERIVDFTEHFKQQFTTYG